METSTTLVNKTFANKTFANKTLARIIGVLFLVPFVTYGFGSGLINSVLEVPKFLAVLAPNNPQMIIGALLMLANSVTVVALGVLLFPVIEQHSKNAALGYLSARIAEAVLLAVGVAWLLLILALGNGSTQSVPPTVHSETLVIETLVTETVVLLAKKANYWLYQIAMIALGVGSIGFCWVLFRAKLVPSVLALLGLVGYCVLIAGAVLEFFGFSVGIMLSLPGGLFELGVGGWLMAKGFSDSTIHTSTGQ
jgi:hypothetical protein